MTGPPLHLRFAPELRLFLAVRHRHEAVAVPYDGTSSLGHVVQSLGVPLTEVGELLLNGCRAAPSHRPRPGDRIAVSAVRRPQPLPVTPPRFVLDVHLGALARRLRVLGVDAAYRNDLDDDALVEQANTERRILLTQDRGLLRRRALWAGAHVYGAGPDQQLRDVLDRFAPPLAPWTRCTACGGPLRPAAKEEVAPRLPPGTRRSYDVFAVCRACGRVYWPGAHHSRLREIVTAATGGPPRSNDRPPGAGPRPKGEKGPRQGLPRVLWDTGAR